jgi:DNA gyrase subunit B
VKVFRDTAHIRERPGMYVGDTSVKGLHHLVYELVYNSVDEALAGHCRTIHVKVNPDGSISVSDDGRGIPVEEHPTEKRSTLEVVMTTVGAGAKFDKNTYKVSAGLHGIGAKAVTALSEWVEAEVRRDGRTWFQEYERGSPITPVTDRGPAMRTGTRITFKPDPLVFRDATFDWETLQARLRELAFLNKGLAIVLQDEAGAKEERFKYDGGIAEYVKWINRDDTTLHEPIYVEKSVEVKPDELVRVEVAMQWTSGEESRERCYANNAYNGEGGTHRSGFRIGLTRTLTAYGNKVGSFREGMRPTGDDFREGLSVVISVQVAEPQLEAQTKIRLNNPEVEGAVASVVSEQLGKYLEEHPKEAQKIMKKVVLAAEAREAAAKARKALKDRKSILSSGGLPGKLFDCSTRERDRSELFLVEGDSAGGSAESGREREYQAILPLRGKPLNVEKARLENMLKNEEITSLISAIGIDIGLEVDGTSEEEREAVDKKIRYGKIIIMTDADVDGQHIRTLLLTFFYRQMKHLVAEGRIYVARPPLYKVTEKKNVRFVQTGTEMHEELTRRGLRNARLAIHPPPVEGAGPPAPRLLAGAELEALVKLMDHLERALVTLERRGVNLPAFVARVTERGLPIFRVLVSGREEWCYTRDEVEALRRREQERLGRELVVADEAPPADGSGNGQANGHVVAFYDLELHEVREVNRGLEELRRYGLQASDLVPAPRVAGREPPVRLRLESGESAKALLHLRELVTEVRRLGERGLSVVRFKGLGEMGADELWETTLDPEKRTLLQVQLDDALKADEMFRTLMGEKVEPRREFITKYALEVKEIDYHGA